MKQCLNQAQAKFFGSGWTIAPKLSDIALVRF